MKNGDLLRRTRAAKLALLGLAALGLGGATVGAATRDLGGGFRDHGVATPLSQHRGMVATVDGAGRDVMLVWLYDHRGGYALLMIDAETGATRQIATPYPWAGDGPFASLLSSRNRYYTHFGSHFSEFDPARGEFTFHAKTAPQMAMGLTEADDGTIWSATYPNSGLAAFDPGSRRFTELKSINTENWRQYPRGVAADDAGWVYVAIGTASGQIVAHDPRSGTTRALLAAEERRQGSATVVRDRNGKVYAQARGGAADGWLELHAGGAKRLDAAPAVRAKPLVAGSQGLFHARFPSGRIAVECDTVERRLTTEDPRTKARRTVRFDYTSDGAHLIALAVAPDGAIAGGTAFPMRMFRYDPAGDTWTNWPGHGQFNTVARHGDRFFVGGYPHGFLLEWDAATPWQRTDKAAAAGNPRYLTECEPTINRPHDLIGMPDGRTVVLAGTPGYGYTGGGLLLWDREHGRGTVLPHGQLLPELSTMSLVAVDTATFLGGTTIGAGTGGETKATQAELYLFDVREKRIVWHAAVFPGARTYTDLATGPRGVIYGIVDRTTFFVFDPRTKTVVHRTELPKSIGGVVTGQGPRALLDAGNGEVLVLCTKGIGRIAPGDFAFTWLADSPVTITAGGDVKAGRVYFAGGSHVYSFTLPAN